MSKCLVTKLKASIENDDLVRYGVVRIPVTLNKVSSGASLQVVWFEESDDNKVVCGGGITLSDGSTVLNGTGTGLNTVNFRTSPTEVFSGYIDIYNKYAISRISGTNMRVAGASYALNIEDLKWTNSPSLKLFLTSSSSYGSVDELKRIPVLDFDGGYLSRIVGTLDDKPRAWKWSSDSSNGFYSTGVLVNAACLGEFEFIKSGSLIKNPKFTGSLEELASSLRMRLGTEGNVRIATNLGAGGVTWKGVKLSGTAERILSWTENTITWNGDTIEG